MTTDYVIAVGATGEPLDAQLIDATGAVVALAHLPAGDLTVTIADASDRTVLVVDAAACEVVQLPDPRTGEPADWARYWFTSDQLATPRRCLVQYSVQYAEGPQRFPIDGYLRLQIVRALGG